MNIPKYPWERVNGVAGPCPKPCDVRPNMNYKQNRKKYFYTILFLDNYYPAQPDICQKSITKQFKISEDMNTANVKWLDDTRLLVRHNLQLPVSVEMWDQNNKPLVYCPILTKDIESISVGDVTVESEGSLIIYFTHINKPEFNQIYTLVIKSQPNFNLENGNKPILPELPENSQHNVNGLAIIFRRYSLDSLFDLIAEFDNAYFHSLEESADLKYLTNVSCYKDLSFQTKYTNNLQDVIDLIDVNRFEIKYSWNDGRSYPNIPN